MTTDGTRMTENFQSVSHPCSSVAQYSIPFCGMIPER